MCVPSLIDLRTQKYKKLQTICHRNCGVTAGAATAAVENTQIQIDIAEALRANQTMDKWNKMNRIKKMYMQFDAIEIVI